jgi:hypothetical protein
MEIVLSTRSLTKSPQAEFRATWRRRPRLRVVQASRPDSQKGDFVTDFLLSSVNADLKMQMDWAKRSHMPSIIVKDSMIHGHGVFTARDILPGEVIIDWDGATSSFIEAKSAPSKSRAFFTERGTCRRFSAGKEGAKSRGSKF